MTHKTHSSLIEPNRIKHEFAGSELFQYFDRTELCFIEFEWLYIHGVFLWVQFDRTELKKKLKYWKNSIRFDIPGKFHRLYFWYGWYLNFSPETHPDFSVFFFGKCILYFFLKKFIRNPDFKDEHLFIIMQLVIYLNFNDAMRKRNIRI